MSVLFTGIMLYAAIWLHPFYISMTDIVYKPNSKTLQVSVRIFTDDFEKTLRKNCNCKVDLSQSGSKAVMNTLVQQYILQHLAIQVNGKPATLTYKGYAKEEESTWSYFEATNLNTPKKISITNSLLHDYKEEQINMLHIIATGQEQTEKLDYPNQGFEVRY